MDNSDHSAPPGHGWTNGDIVVNRFQRRRWTALASGWTRIGATDTELARRTSSSQATGTLTLDPAEEATRVKTLICQLCEFFYQQGWATGTGGGVSIRVPVASKEAASSSAWRVFVAPSGIQKEDMIVDDIFELDMDRNVIVPPVTPNLRQSACTPLWYVVYTHRPTARCVIHTHSRYAQLATLLDRSECAPTLRITYLEMLKGVGQHGYDDVLDIPIIDNRPTEDLLAAQLAQAVQAYPRSNAVLVRRHGLYVWGDSWEQAKTQCESFDYLLQSVVEAHQLGLDLSRVPVAGTYREDDTNNDVAPAETSLPAAKKLKTGTEMAASSSTVDFNGMGATSNAADVRSNVIPLVPRNSNILLLDIEGCTTSISFVHDTLFPYVRQHLAAHLASLNPEATVNLVQGLESDVKTAQLDLHDVPNAGDASSLVNFLMDHDVKGGRLKELQGIMWKKGYETGTLQGHVYDDVPLLLEWAATHHVRVYIYSSGSIQAQKLLFGFSMAGNLRDKLAGHFDIPTAGPKKDAASYTSIAATIGVAPREICFVSDAEAELAAAAAAGIGQVVMSVRAGNAPLTEQGKKRFPVVHSLLQLCGE